MFRRKLQALEYPSAVNFDPTDPEKFRNLITWLEDERIRHYVEHEREPLRVLAKGSEEWEGAFQKYLHDLGISSSVPNSSRNEVLDVLLTKAVSLEYGDESNGQKYAAASKDKVLLEQGVEGGCPKVMTQNPLDKLDFSSPDFIKGVNDLADLLKVNRHPTNHLLTLQACATLLNQRYSKEAIKNGDNVLRKGVAFPFQEVDQSFDGGDKVLNQAAKILRLSFITDLRDLQTRINECIVAVQSITANPKTDTKLGKVGY